MTQPEQEKEYGTLGRRRTGRAKRPTMGRSVQACTLPLHDSAERPSYQLMTLPLQAGDGQRCAPAGSERSDVVPTVVRDTFYPISGVIQAVGTWIHVPTAAHCPHRLHQAVGTVTLRPHRLEGGGRLLGSRPYISLYTYNTRAGGPMRCRAGIMRAP